MTPPLRYTADLDAATQPDEPGELLAAAFAGCLLKGLERAAAYRRFRYADARVRVTVQRRESPPSFSRVEYELELATDEPPGRVALVHRELLEYGPVVSTLAKACELDGRVVVREPARA